jgi:hypothetical protein
MSHVRADIKKVALVVICIALVLGATGGLVGTFVFSKPGAQGEQGLQGIQGEQGPQVEPGISPILQMIQIQNITEASLADYNAKEWYNMPVVDDSMHLTVTINDQSRICAEFLTSVYLGDSWGSFWNRVWLRVVVDNQYFSTVSYVSGLPNMYMPVQVKILTDTMSAGEHTIDAQFYRVNGLPTLMDRSLSATELTAGETTPT